MLTLGSFILLIILGYGLLRKKDYLLFVIKILVVFSVYINMGYFLKVGSFELAYSEVLLVLAILISFIKIRLEFRIPTIMYLLIFAIVIFTGFLALVNGSAPMVIPMGSSWDDYFYGRIGMTEATLNISHVIRVFRIILFIAVYYIIDKYVIRDVARSNEIKRFIVKIAAVFAFMGIFEQITKLFNSNIFIDIAGQIFGVGNSQLTWLVERGSSPVLQGLTLEPGHYAQSFIPAILILFTDKLFTERQRFMYFVLFGYVIFFCGSFAGIGIFLVMSIMYLFSKGKYIVIKVGTLIFFGLIGLLVFGQRNPLMFQYYTLRIQAAIKGEDIGSSDGVRMLTLENGLDLFQHNPLIGVGFGTTSINGFIPSLLVNVGIIGTILWFVIMLKGFTRTVIVNRSWLVLVILLFMLVGGMKNFYGVEMILLFALVFRKPVLIKEKDVCLNKSIAQ
ncbi:hypothetical protein [Sporosarcina sp. 6E9]|uniref:hypothetical protein n=1 Tax=Sporosarcina sp. 6E9 TaxID=2819235 RepID=UPI001B3042EC|nr:hypothetical protein [Sporosarcina sp. 6E9]